MTTLQQRLKELVRCFEDAYVLRDILQTRREDRRLIDSGWQLRYAVDSNVLALHADPKSHAVAHPKFRTIGAGEVFRHDDQARKEHVAAALSEYIWHTLQPDSPLLVLPPIDLEADRITQYYLRDFEQYTQQSLLNEVRKSLDQIGHFSRDALSDMRDAMMLDGSRHAALLRINSILTKGRVRSSRVRTTLKGFDDVFLKALLPGTDFEDIKEFNDKREAWLSRMQKIGRSVSANTKRDAEAMARLEICNCKLLRGGTKHRLIYITTDSSLLLASAEYEFSCGGQELGSFDKLFVRHPRAYLDEKEVLSPARERGNTSLVQWLQMTLGRFDELEAPQVSVVAATLTEPIQNEIVALGAKDTHAAEKILAEWKNYESEAIHDIPDKFADRLLQLLNNRGADRRQELDALRSEIREAKRKAWDSYFLIGLSTRTILQVLADAGLTNREPPSLLFEDRENLRAFLKQAHTWLRNPKTFSLDAYTEAKEAVRNEDQTGYGEYLAHGYFMAWQMQWRTAAILAMRALECVPNDDCIPGASNGREAYYFRAFCLRHSAHSLDDLKPLEDLLSQAERVARKERENVIDVRWALDQVPERFEGERYALRLSRILFEWDAAPARQRAGILVKAVELVAPLNKLNARLRVRMDQLNSDSSLSVSEESPAYFIPVTNRAEQLRKLQLRVLRNVLAIALQIPAKRDDGFAAWSDLRKEGGNTKALVNTEYSYFSNFLMLCGNIHFAKDVDLVSASWAQLAERYDPASIRNRATFPYDTARMTDILEKLPPSVAGIETSLA